MPAAPAETSACGYQQRQDTQEAIIASTRLLVCAFSLRSYFNSLLKKKEEVENISQVNQSVILIRSIHIL